MRSLCIERIPTRRSLSAIVGLLLAAGLGLPARADDIAAKGREIFNQHQRSVVTLQLVVKTKFSMGGRSGQSNEQMQMAAGTVLDASGLTVVSLSGTDPGQMVANVAGGDSRYKMEAELSDIKLLLDDGTELPAEVVLRDNDLDLAFVRPKTKPAAAFQPVDLAQPGKAEVLDAVVALNRLGNAAGRAYSASVERISAIVQRPRLFYIPDANMTTSALGCPAFTLDGKYLGTFVLRAMKGRGASAGVGGQPDNITGIILPAGDIAKAAKQVPPLGTDTKEPAKETK